MRPTIKGPNRPNLSLARLERACHHQHGHKRIYAEAVAGARGGHPLVFQHQGQVGDERTNADRDCKGSAVCRPQRGFRGGVMLLGRIGVRRSLGVGGHAVVAGHDAGKLSASQEGTRNPRRRPRRRPTCPEGSRQPGGPTNAATAISAPVRPMARPHRSAGARSPIMVNAPGASTAAPMP